MQGALGNIGTENTFTIEKLIYVPLGEHNPMYSRPLTANVTAGAVDRIVDKILETGASALTPSIIGSVNSSELVQPSSKAMETPVNQGWLSQRRYIFILIVSSIDYMGNEKVSYIQGFTNYDGINEHTSSSDPHMVHYINSVIETARISYTTPTGPVVQEKLHRVYDVISNNKVSVRDFGMDIITHRPMDIVDNISTLMSKDMIMDGFDNYDGMNSFMNIGNYLPTGIPNTSQSKRDNLVPSRYVASVLNGAIVHKVENEFAFGDDAFDNSYSVVKSSIRSIAEPSLVDNQFLNYMSKMDGGGHYVRDQFELNRLSRMDPTILDRMTLVRLNNNTNFVDPILSNSPAVGEFWHGNDPVTLKAYSLIESAAALATRFGFTKLYFNVSNMINFGSPEPTIVILNSNSFISLMETDTIALYEMFKNAFVTEVFYPETMGNQTPLHAEFIIDLMGTSKVYLDYIGSGGIWYTAPSALSSISSSVIGTDTQVLDNNALSFSNLVDTITNVKGHVSYSNHF